MTHSVAVVCSWPVLDTLLLWIQNEGKREVQERREEEGEKEKTKEREGDERKRGR